ncbi:NAD-dependent deacetylase [Rubricella aquisinus]|uniref:NAD-dependent protein deacylase n=1 Tax=Rubricella aquisinus TaxID=2028108 RepID=A0A840WY37_9RHOB|nr:NAD-dependent deacylase [Rubricella aquisinus]MBB5514586.1 NAD-dependent deacetylase [Rubricella aquisinus]
MSNWIVILTGAGVSAESGLGTFRDKDGMWTKYDLSEVATPEGYARNPGLVHDFYNARRRNCLDASPNPAHAALATLAAQRSVTLITQNVDDLHERAGSRDVIHMHGELTRAWCLACDQRMDWRDDLTTETPCPKCATPALRPDIVWFGEIPYHMEEIDMALRQASLFVAIGTSGEVYPAAGFVAEARAMGIPALELNMEPTGGRFDDGRYGPASRIVPDWVNEMLGT